MTLSTTKSFRSKLYDFHINNTHVMYKDVLATLSPKSRILEVGIGNGTCVEKNAELIRKKKFQIEGIDIDTDYLQICNLRILSCGLESQVVAREQDLLEMKEPKKSSNKYDHILFMESYPVIPIEIMKKMMDKCRKLIRDGGKLLFVHNLVEIKNPVADFLKPRLKDIPFLRVDFGRLTTHAEFDEFIQSTEYQITEKKMLMEVDFNSHYNTSILPSFINNMCTMKQYFIECIPK